MTTAANPGLGRVRRLGILLGLSNFIRGLWEAPRDAAHVRLKPSFDFSLTFLIYCSMILFLGLAAVNSQANLLFAVLGLMIGILVISIFLCRLVLSRLRVTRILPDYVTVGQSATIQYRFENAKRFWPSLSVTLSEIDGSETFQRPAHAYLLHAAARMSAVAPVDVIPRRRGLHKLARFQLSSSFPFGFIHRAVMRRHEDSILTYPAAAEVSPRLLMLCRSAERGGADMHPRPNGSDEFYGVKEFRAGDNPRWIYWKRSARTGALVSREMAQIAPPQLLILVDTFIDPSHAHSTDHRAASERTIAMAASLAREALATSMAVGLVIWNERWTTIAPQRSKRHCLDLLAAIATAPINHAAPVDQLLARGMGMLRSSMTPVLFTPREMQIGRLDHARGGLLVVASESSQAQAWFKFDPAIDFAHCGPMQRESKSSRRAGGRP